MILENELSHAIAAGSFRLVPVPGTELCEGDAQCPFCGSPAHTLPHCPAFAAAGGTPLIAGLRQEIEMLESCLHAANLQHNNLIIVARLACDALEAIVDGSAPVNVLAAYDALCAELNPTECE